MTREPTFLKDIRKKLAPEKDFFKKVDEVITKINEILKSENVNAICVAGGSVAKGTLIKDDYDADLFVRFDYDTYKTRDISGELEKILKIFGKKYNRVHGSRDYFQIKIGKLTYEFVPVLKVEDYTKANNVTDMSPLHVGWVKSHATPKILEDIRLAKQFCKANELYGAESFIAGFSGHILDIMTIHYGSFMNLLEASVDWEDKEKIDVEHHLNDPLNELNSVKLDSPMMVVDPIQPERNASAALGYEKFELFKKKANQFLTKPSETFFIKKKFNINSIKNKKIPDSKLFVLKAEAEEGKTDIIGAKLMKAHNFIKGELERNDFIILESNWNWDKKNECYFYYFLKDEKLSSIVEKKGPPIKSTEDAKRFQAKHETIYVKNNRMFSKIKRKYTTPLKLIDDLIKGEYVKGKVKRIKREA